MSEKGSPQTGGEAPKQRDDDHTLFEGRGAEVPAKTPSDANIVAGAGDATLVPEVERTQIDPGASSTPDRGGRGPSVDDPPTARVDDVLTEAELPRIEGFTLSRQIGRGGMGVVYEGRQSYVDRRCAVKVMNLQHKRGEFARRFQREAKILAGLTHQNIVACYQAGVTPAGNPYIAMEFIDGPNLRDWIDEHGELGVESSLRLTRSVALALEHAHKAGIIHRDVKPENVLLQRDEALGGAFPFQAKLADLGLARPSEIADSKSMQLTQQGAVMGTPSTMAPEQFDDPDRVDFRADIYGLGCVLFHALTGRLAYPQRTISETLARKMAPLPPDPREVVQSLGPEVADLTMKLLAKARESRPASYAELVAGIDALLAARARPKAKSGLRVPVLAGASVVVIGGLAWYFLGRGESLDPSTEVDAVRGSSVAHTEEPGNLAEDSILPASDDATQPDRGDATPQDPSESTSSTSSDVQADDESSDPPLELGNDPPNPAPALTLAVEAGHLVDGVIRLAVRASPSAEPASEPLTIELEEGGRLETPRSIVAFDALARELVLTDLPGGDGPAPATGYGSPDHSTLVFQEARGSYTRRLALRARSSSGDSAAREIVVRVSADDDAPELVLPTGVQSVGASERGECKAQAPDRDSDQLSWLWRQLDLAEGEPPVDLLGSETSYRLRFRAPEVYGTEVRRMRFAVEVKDEVNTRTGMVEFDVQPFAPQRKPLAVGEKRPLLVTKEDVDGWTAEGGAKLVMGRDKTWLLQGPSANGAVQRDLPHGRWRLNGQVRVTAPDKPPPERASVRILGNAMGVEIGLMRAPDGQNAELVTERIERAGDGRWAAVPGSRTTRAGIPLTRTGGNVREARIELEVTFDRVELVVRAKSIDGSGGVTAIPGEWREALISAAGVQLVAVQGWAAFGSIELSALASEE